MTVVAAASVASDEGLIGAARRGDLYAWELLVRRHQEAAFRIAYLLVRTTSVAEEATEAAFTRAYRALPSLDEGTALVPWLFRIVIGEARQKRRESGRTPSSSRPPEARVGPHIPATPIAGLSAAAGMTPLERDNVTDAFGRLAAEDRLVIAGRYLLGLSRDETAAALAIPSGLVEAHLRDALTHLRSRMGLT